MKTLRKLSLLCLALTLILCLTACGSAEKTAESTTAAPTEAAVETAEAEPASYDLSGKDENIDGQTYDGDVIVTGENGMITFTNCTFNGNIINNGGEGAKVFVGADCSFGADTACILDTSLEEATMETDLPKFMIFCELPDIVCEKIGAVVAFADQVISVNGKEYPIDAADYYMNESTGEFVPYSGQEVNMQNIAMWTENGEEVQMHIAVYAN